MPEMVDCMDGVWYNAHAGEFVEFEDMGDGIAFVNPGSGDHYHSVTYAEFEDLRHDLYSVSEEAIENPVETLEQYNPSGVSNLSKVPYEVRGDVAYAIANTEIQETDSANYILEYV